MESRSPSPAPTFSVPVTGGELHVHDLSGPAARPDGPLILLVHGITGNGLSWVETATALDSRPALAGYRIWAPDLRGRAESRHLTDFGLAAHVADLATLADTAGVDRFLHVGHSMGGFIGALTASTIPERLRGLVLVDGGPAFPSPPAVDVDAALHAVIGPAMDRLSMRFADDDAYLDFWRQHPAVAPLLDGPDAVDVRSYLLHDLVDAEDASGRKMSSCVLEAIRADGRDVLTSEDAHNGVRAAVEAGVPTEFVWAQRGLMNEEQGLYDEQRIAALQLPHHVGVTAVRDVNHYDIIFVPTGTGAIADAVERVVKA